MPDVVTYLSRTDVKRALHTYLDTQWEECNDAVQTAFNTPPPAVQFLPHILENMPVLLYNGDQDWICNHQGTEAMIKNLVWKGLQGFSPHAKKFAISGAEFTSERGLYYAKVYNASHMVPYDHGEVAQNMLYTYLKLI